VAYDSGKGEVFVANSTNVSVISDATNKVIATIPVGSVPTGLAYDGGKGEVFVANSGSNNVSVISDATNKVIATIPVRSQPGGVAYDSGKGEVFVTNQGSNTVSVISDATNKVIATIPVGSVPAGLAYDSGKGEVFVTNFNSNNVSVISDATNKVIATIPVGSQPGGVAYDSGKGEVFVANDGSNNVSVISDATNKVIATIPIGNGPNRVAYDSRKGEVFVANRYSNNVSVISDTSDTVTSTVTVGAAPAFAAYDLSNGYVYVSNSVQGTISIITTGPTPSTNSVSFSQSGLPAGTNWSVTLNNQTLYSTTKTITFNETNGTYTFTVGTVSGYTSNVTSGSVTVNGLPVSRSITFTPQAPLTSVRVSPSSVTLKVGTYANFTATPSCTGGPCSGVTYSWSLNNTTLGNLNASSGASVKFTATASGTEHLSVTAMLNGQIAKNSSIITITTTPVPTLAYVSLTPLATTVNVSGTQTFTAAVGCSGGTCPSGSTYAWSLNNSLGKLNMSSGPQVLFTANSTAGLVTLTVTAHLNGKTATNVSTITIKKASPPPSNYAVTFSESGLPSGTSWSVSLNGVMKSGTGSIVFTEPNGTYSFSVGVVSGYTASPTSGSFTVNGVAVNRAITFTALPPGQHSLTFSETGLPAGTNWSVTVGTTTHTTTGGTISFAEVNGTYSYTVGAVVGYTATPSSGSVTVNGATKAVSIAFAKASTGATYAVTFTETGLPAGTSWSVTLNGSTKSSTTATVTFQEANGSYSFTVGSVSGYTVGPSPGTIKVDGAAMSQSITFTSSTSPGKGNQATGFLGLPGYGGYILIGVIVVAVATGALILLLRKRSPPRGSGSVQDSKNIADGAASQVAVE
jgi:YVTN family beta-propeller protein